MKFNVPFFPFMDTYRNELFYVQFKIFPHPKGGWFSPYYLLEALLLSLLSKFASKSHMELVKVNFSPDG